ncbi:MAG TPA: DUF420 domain-containing protein [Tepidisphaeraceae bacterium]|nr:DUF420 domain-containing protein [Tepidisphaeraceae bacterium]
MNFGFPELDASLNALCGCLLVTAFVCIKRRNWRAHGWSMVGATFVSAIFLACYLTYHIKHGEKSTATTHAPHWLRMVYLAILFPHLLLALLMLPMIYLALRRAYFRQWERHRRIALPTFMIWLYVSVTGVVVYWMLYHTSLVS